MASAPDLCMSTEGDEFSVSKNCKRRYPHQPAGHGTCWTFQPMPEEADQKVEFVSGAAPRIRLRSVVGLDVGKSATKAVFIRQTKSGMVVSEARLLPPLDVSSGEGRRGAILPPSWKSNYVALAVSPQAAMVRYVTLHGRPDVHSKLGAELQAHLSVEENTRAAFMVVPHHRRESETNVLIVAVPEALAKGLLERVTGGSIAAASLEVAGVTSVGAFMEWGPLRDSGAAVGYLDCGASSSVLALFNRGNLCLMRKLAFGADAMTAAIADKMQTDRKTAEEMILDESFDISSIVAGMTDDFRQQIRISTEFVERREGVRVEKFYAAGGLSVTPYMRSYLASHLERAVELWNPFSGLTCAGDDWQEKIRGQEPRFAAALGAAVGTLQGAQG